jgi:hypothetical protein
MHQVEEMSAELDHLGRRKLSAWSSDIYIAANRGERSQRSQAVENRRIANIARVQDVVDVRQRRDCLGPQQAVRV